jgi:hypothetical protein
MTRVRTPSRSKTLKSRALARSECFARPFEEPGIVLAKVALQHLFGVCSTAPWFARSASVGQEDQMMLLIAI